MCKSPKAEGRHVGLQKAPQRPQWQDSGGQGPVRRGQSSRQRRGVLSLEGVRPDFETMPWGALGRQDCGRRHGEKALQGPVEPGPVKRPWCYRP